MFDSIARSVTVKGKLTLNKAYVFKQRSWRLDSAVLSEVRPLSAFEKKCFDLPIAGDDDKKQNLCGTEPSHWSQSATKRPLAQFLLCPFQPVILRISLQTVIKHLLNICSPICFNP